jgi:hypothetical protein
LSNECRLIAEINDVDNLYEEKNLRHVNAIAHAEAIFEDDTFLIC